jgi:hypothetical protein
MSALWIMVRWGVLVAVLASLGCGTTPKGAPFRPAMLAPDEAAIYIFRMPEPWMRSGPVSVYINQQYQGDIRPGEHIAVAAKAGEYLIRVEAGSSMVSEARVAPGVVEYRQVKMKRRARVVIEAVEPEVGRRLIAGTKRSPLPPEPSESPDAVLHQSAAR